MLFGELQSLLSSSDVNDLQNFVNVALATAAGGEDDLTHDKLSDLRTVGSGFGPLIYNLPENACFADLTERWESLWEALRNSQDLPGKLVRKPCDLNFFMFYHLHAVILQGETDFHFVDILQPTAGVVQVSQGDTWLS